MGQTIAEKLKEEGGVEMAREILLRQLGLRFGEVPADTVATIETTASLAQLKDWMARFATAKTLEEIGIAPAAEKAVDDGKRDEDGKRGRKTGRTKNGT